MPRPERVLEVESLRREFPGRGRGAGTHVAVDDLSFTLDAGVALAIVGDSGAGKTTAVRMIAGLIRPTGGRILVAGRLREAGPVGAAERRRRARETQLVFQDPYASLDPRRTVAAELGAVLDLHFRPSRGQRDQRIAALLDDVGLTERHAGLRPRALSGGERQRVAIARALAAQPRVLLLDEPVAALDVSIQAQILNLLVDLRYATGIALVLVSHDLGVVRHACDHAVVMHGGRAVERGPVAELFANPTHPYTPPAAGLDAPPRLAAEARAGAWCRLGMSSATRNRHQSAMEPAAHPSFADELTQTWGDAWGAADEIGPLRRVLVRAPGDELAVVSGEAWDEDARALVDPDGRWYWTDRKPPDLARVRREHAGLVAALRAEGIEAEVAVPLGSGFTKALYVRDPLVTIPGGAIIGRMAVRMRRGEEPDITRTVAGLGMPILGTITGTGTLEGGSFVKLQPGRYALGTSIRCNHEGARQLATLLELQGAELLLVPIPGCSIHLDLHLAVVDVDRVLVDAAHLPHDFLVELRRRGFELIEADPSEPWGLNLLAVRPGRVLLSETNPRTAERLTARGVEVVEVPYREIQKNGGGIHCSTIELVRDRATG